MIDIRQPGTVLLQMDRPAHDASWLLFTQPERILEVRELNGVLPALRELEHAVTGGKWAAGFVTYEAASAFDEAMVTHAPGALPLLWFGLYRAPQRLSALPDAEGEHHNTAAWQPSVSETEYRAAIAEIRDQIARGNTYQVNYTLRLRAEFAGSPWSLFRTLVRVQQPRCAAYVQTAGHTLCSASPELFFRLDGTHIESRPMKGTAPRGLTTNDDDRRAEALSNSVKERAENVMIVDMVRNDLSRIAARGSVHVPRLFEVERYPTLLQMTSTVAAETSAPLSEIFAALFPCASITGAPKISTMRIIRRLENSPRGIYTGAIGFAGPQRQAQFNVAIRTVCVDHARGTAEYGTGGGIVWDSLAEQEYAEWKLKAAVLTHARPKFELLETLRWRAGEGIFLLERHLDRLLSSARYFGYPVERAEVVKALEEGTRGLSELPQMLRLLVDEAGRIRIENGPVLRLEYWRVALAREPVDERDPFLYHKTTHRVVYEAARAAHPEADDVILWNRRGELTESTRGNLALRRGGRWLTPPIECGLLAGTYRAEMLEQGKLREAVLTRDDLKTAEAIWFVNSVRRWVPARLIS